MIDRRILKTLEYIERNYGRHLGLSELARIACLSRYRFSRVFHAAVGKTIPAYLRELRVGKAVERLRNSDESVTTIAAEVGFNSLSSFHDAFRAVAGCSPTTIRTRKVGNKPEETGNKAGDRIREPDDHRGIPDFIRRVIEMNLTQETLPDMRVAYLSRCGSYLDTGELWSRLLSWASGRGLFPPTQKFIGISYDEPDVPDDRKRSDACVTLPEGFDRSDNTVQYKTLRGGAFFLYRFYDRVDRLALAYKEIVSEWLPTSDYELDLAERDFLEVGMSDKDAEGRMRIHLYIPVRPKT